MNEIIVIAARTSLTPEPDATHFYGPPGLWPPEHVDRVLVSCTFTWDKHRAENLALQWQTHFPGAEVLLGGPAYGDPGGEFDPGKFLRRGMVITTRGCPGCAQPCLVPEREGPLRLLKIKDGWNVLDNNLLAASWQHIDAVLEMLERQSRAAVFSGGLEARRLLTMPGLVEDFCSIRLKHFFLAYDCPQEREWALEAITALRDGGLSQRQTRCYVLVGRDDDTVTDARERLQAVWDAGGLPFAMLWRDEDAQTRKEPGWQELVREWTRPAAMFAIQEGKP